MTSNDGAGRDPVDPDFAGLFRPDGHPPPPVEPAVPAGSAPAAEAVLEPVAGDPLVDEQPAPAMPDAPVPEPAGEEPAAIAREPAADTGRLFRSQGVREHDEAVLALTSDHFGRLKSLERRFDDAVALPDAGPVEPIDAADPIVAGLLGSTAPGDDAMTHAPSPSPRSGGRRARTAQGIRAGAVYLVVIGVTVLVGFANALLADGSLGWPTGLALAISSVYAALTVRREDDAAAMIVPPIAFLVAALTAGQLFLGSAEGSLVNRAVVAFFTLADNWMWIIGSTVAALIIVLVRRRRG